MYVERVSRPVLPLQIPNYHPHSRRAWSPVLHDVRPNRGSQSDGKETASAIRGWHCPKDTLVVAKAKLGLEPRFRKRFGALTLDGNRMQTRSRASSPKIAIGLAG